MHITEEAVTKAAQNLSSLELERGAAAKLRLDFVKIIADVLDSLEKAVRHHAGLTSSRHLESSSFMNTFLNSYATDLFKTGFAFGCRLESGQTDNKFLRHMESFIKEKMEQLIEQAESVFNDRLTAECFAYASQRAFELGADSGESFTRDNNVI